MAVYLDHAATTPMLPEAIAAYMAALGSVGNPASIHAHGQNARRMLEESRERIAATLGCDPIEVIFTSGGTEAVNLALKGIYWARQSEGRRPVIAVADGEHHATLDTVEWLEAHEGARAAHLQLDAEAVIDIGVAVSVLDAASDDTALVTALWANNEVGTIEPVQALAAIAAARGIPLHLDAVAAYGHLPIDLAALRAGSRASGASGPVAISVSAHKIGGPVGIGALVLSRSAQIVPVQHGGGQQRNVRSGTQDVAAAVSFAVAAESAERERLSEVARLGALQERLIGGVLAALPEVRLNGAAAGSGGVAASGGAGSKRLPNNANFFFPGAQGDSLLMMLDMAGISVSTGSACQAGIPEPSHVLLAMGRDERDARSVLRVTLGRSTTAADINAFVAAIPDAYRRAADAGLADRASRFNA